MTHHYVYQCDICKNVVELVHEGGGRLVCCGKEMRLLEENTVEASREKHLPVIEKRADGIFVKIGSVEHPMIDTHWINFIDLIAGPVQYRKHLNPGEKPEALFPLVEGEFVVREFCNLHGIWKGDSK